MSGHGRNLPYEHASKQGPQPPGRPMEPPRPAVHDQTPQYSLNFLDVSAHHQSLTQHPPESANTSRYDFPLGLEAAQGGEWAPHQQYHGARIFHVNVEDDEGEDEGRDEESQRFESPATTSAEAGTAKRKMKRFRLTHTQTRYLMDEFLKQPHPDAAHREYLSRLIPGLSPRQVQIWFQNRRAKLKRLSADDKERLMQQQRILAQNSPGTALEGRSAIASTTPEPERARGSFVEDPGQAQAPSSAATAREHEHGRDEASTMSPTASTFTTDTARSSSSGRRRKSRANRDTVTIFGWDVSVYVDDSGSELEDDGESIVSSEQSADDTGPQVLSRQHSREQRHRVPMVEVGIPERQEYVWSMPPIPSPAPRNPLYRRPSEVQDPTQRPGFTSSTQGSQPGRDQRGRQ